MFSLLPELPRNLVDPFQTFRFFKIWMIDRIKILGILVFSSPCRFHGMFMR